MTALMEGEQPFEDSELSFADYLSIIKRRWWVVVGAALLLGLAALAWSMLQTRTYQAQADVLLRTSDNEQLFPGVPFTQDVDIQRRTLAEENWIASDNFDNLLEDAGVNPAQFRLSIPNISAGDRNVTGNLLSFIVTGSDAAKAAADANAAAEIYVRERHAAAVDDFERRRGNEADELARMEQDLRVLEQPIVDLEGFVRDARSTEEADRFRDQLAQLLADTSTVGERLDLNRSIETLTARVAETEELRAVLADEEISARVNTLAEEPSSPVTPKTMRNLLLGLVLGTLGGLGAALLWESLDDKISAEDDVALLGATVLASIPIDGEATDKKTRLFAAENGSGREMEAYRTARAALNFASEGSLSSFLVTSALPSEGKSTTSANLAVALSMAGQKTLLIDADLRRPTLHKYFELANGVGLRSVLTGEVDANDVMTVTGYGEMLALISAGKPGGYPSELLSNGRLEELVMGAKEVFDVVVIDTPPLFLVSDAALVAPSVDGIVLSVTSGMENTGASKKSDFRRLVSAVNRLRTPLLGAVLHGGGVGSYGYGYKYNYYSAAAEEANGTAGPASGTSNGSDPASASSGQSVSHAAVPPDEWVEDRIDVGPATRR